jgi:hypothetical protein
MSLPSVSRHLHWFYNPDHPTPSEPIELDLRVGGSWRQRMVVDERTAYRRGPEGGDQAAGFGSCRILLGERRWTPARSTDISARCETATAVPAIR